jgi:hypothetical protein
MAVFYEASPKFDGDSPHTELPVLSLGVDSEFKFIA